jgi:hypothetical protein
MRTRLLRALNHPVVLLVLLATPLLLAAPATADPTVSSSWQLLETPGIDMATDSHGVQYPYVALPTGGRWYLECPLEPTSGGPSGTDLKASIPLDKDHDRCGNDEGANAATYLGATWTTSTFADVNVDPNDVRCGQLVAHRADANPADAVGPMFCTDRVLLYPTMNPNVAKALARWWPTEVLDSCPQTTDLPTNPHSGLGCAGWKAGDFANDDPPEPLQWWHKNGHGGVECSRIPKDHIPASIDAWAQGNPAALRQACGVMNNFVTGAPPQFVPSVDLLSAARAALAESGPDKQPKWAWSVCCGDTSVHTDVDWRAVATTVGGCLVGGGVGAVTGGPLGAVIGCAAVGYAAYKLNSWLESQDCSLTSWHCIVNAVGRWSANGFVTELKFGLHQLTHGMAPQALFSQDAFIRMWEALALVSALLVAVYALGAFGVSIGTLRPSIAMTSIRNIAVWGWALAAAIPFTRLLLAAADGVTTFICSWAGAHSWQGLSDRFQATITSTLSNSLPSDSQATMSLLLLLLVIIGAFAALWLAVWSFIRAAAIGLAVLGIPLSAAALVGPPSWRRAPQLALSTLFGLILFKPLVAVVLVLGIGLMGTATSLGAFLIGVVCVLGAAFAPRHIIRLVGGGIDSVAHGEAGHSAVIAGAAATTLGAQRLYQMGRGRWTPARAGGGGGGGDVARGSVGGGVASGQASDDGARIRTLPPRATGIGEESPPPTASHAPTWHVGPPSGGGSASTSSSTDGNGRGVQAQEPPPVREIVDRHRAGDQ